MNSSRDGYVSFRSKLHPPGKARNNATVDNKLRKSAQLTTSGVLTTLMADDPQADDESTCRSDNDRLNLLPEKENTDKKKSNVHLFSIGNKKKPLVSKVRTDETFKPVVHAVPSTPSTSRIQSPGTANAFYGETETRSKYFPARSTSNNCFDQRYEKRTDREGGRLKVFPKFDVPNLSSYSGSQDKNLTSTPLAPSSSRDSIFSPAFGVAAATSTGGLDVSKIDKTGKGFSNLGNTCYMNATLQALFSLGCFAKELFYFYDHYCQDIGSDIADSIKLLHPLVELLKMRESGGELIAKESALTEIKELVWKKYTGYTQQDAHEFLVRLLDQLEREITLIREDNNLIVSTFELGTKFVYQCLRPECRDKAEGNPDYVSNHLSLDLKSVEVANGETHRFTLQEMVDFFFRDETVGRKCEKCEHEGSSQSQKVSRLPRILILHMKRFSYQNSNYLTKISQRLRLPRYITLSHLCDVDVAQDDLSPVTLSTDVRNMQPLAQMDTPVKLKSAIISRIEREKIKRDSERSSRSTRSWLHRVADSDHRQKDSQFGTPTKRARRSSSTETNAPSTSVNFDTKLEDDLPDLIIENAKSSISTPPPAVTTVLDDVLVEPAVTPVNETLLDQCRTGGDFLAASSLSSSRYKSTTARGTLTHRYSLPTRANKRQTGGPSLKEMESVSVRRRDAQKRARATCLENVDVGFIKKVGSQGDGQRSLIYSGAAKDDAVPTRTDILGGFISHGVDSETNEEDQLKRALEVSLRDQEILESVDEQSFQTDLERALKLSMNTSNNNIVTMDSSGVSTPPVSPVHLSEGGLLGGGDDGDIEFKDLEIDELEGTPTPPSTSIDSRIPLSPSKQTVGGIASDPIAEDPKVNCAPGIENVPVDADQQQCEPDEEDSWYRERMWSLSETELNNLETNGESGFMKDSYRLVAVINHVGPSTNRGHYVTEVLKEQTPDSEPVWNSFDDSSVKVVSEQNVIDKSEKTSYLVFLVHKDFLAP